MINGCEICVDGYGFFMDSDGKIDYTECV